MRIRGDIMPLEPDFSVLLDGSPSAPFTAAMEAEIDRLWTSRKARQGASLFNGPVLSLVSAEPRRLVLRTMEYRHLVAAADSPDLAARIAIEPVGVTGLLLCRDGLVLGRRAGGMASAAGCWEPVPAGSLDRADPAAVLLSELREEMGLSAAAWPPPRPVALLRDSASGIADIVYRLTCTLGADEIARAHDTGGSGEYDAIAVVAAGDLPSFLDRHSGTLASTAAALAQPGLLQDSLHP